MIQAIVPAYNEAATVGSVVSVLRAVGLPVIVVDDGSSDGTSELARAAGAHVLATGQNGGKAQAMVRGIEESHTDPVAFFDADLVGLRPHHVSQLVEASLLGYDMVCGVRDYGLIGNPLQPLMPLITGERIVRRWVLDAVPDDCWRGYAIETAMNHAVKRYGGRTAVVPMQGVTIRTKVDKAGMLRGLAGHAKMFSKIALVDQCLDEGGSCETE